MFDDGTSLATFVFRPPFSPTSSGLIALAQHDRPRPRPSAPVPRRSRHLEGPFEPSNSPPKHACAGRFQGPATESSCVRTQGFLLFVASLPSVPSIPFPLLVSSTFSLRIPCFCVVRRIQLLPARHVVASDGSAVVFCTIDLVDLQVSLGMMVDSIGSDFPIDWEAQ